MFILYHEAKLLPYGERTYLAKCITLELALGELFIIIVVSY